MSSAVENFSKCLEPAVFPEIVENFSKCLEPAMFLDGTVVALSIDRATTVPMHSYQLDDLAKIS